MKHYSRWIILALSIVLAVASYFYIDSKLNTDKFAGQMGQGPSGRGGPDGPRGAPGPGKGPTMSDSRAHQDTNNDESAVKVSVIKVQSGEYAPIIQGTAVTAPRYSLTLTSQVSGEVIEISPQLEAGKRVKQGDVLAVLRNRELNSAVASAEKTLASAELALKEEVRQGDQAKAEWQAAGFTDQPDSDLTWRIPQLAEAKAEVNSAKAALMEARENLQHTKVVAPFNGLVTARTISPGSYLSSSSEIATLYSTDRVEITLELASSDWAKLPDAKALLAGDWPVTVKSIDSQASWAGTVISVGQHIDTTTRMRSLNLAVEAPLDQASPLLPGAFVTVELQGKTLQNLWKLPNSALSQRGDIWFIDENHRLDYFPTTPLFVDAQYTYILVPEMMRDTPYSVLTKPYNSYQKGTLVDAMEQTEK
ncbi:efflux RND transporter periplasmic adaptor subunit [Marinomonas posidonica]|uniref:Efflux transporter, RND family, MFP subunit n=1 Tax=Marinomonas posidonica (strain CECT 7376 / NCIMB 14433 / IVIA-Po-181) TaxID=491952 RepID=F6CW72_MARPP|nr:efflux RND transporter periplasmic adaptor subunit [Marinomonas posidonica]AEF55433.1 efflux transporter, RND family, MFP subunit [Marinomonas posidonica IVIA-Po-181]